MKTRWGDFIEEGEGRETERRCGLRGWRWKQKDIYCWHNWW